MNCYLVTRGPRVYVVNDMTDYVKPIMIRDYWPTTSGAQYLPDGWKEGELKAQSLGSGRYTLHYKSHGFGEYVMFELTELGKTRSVLREEIPIICPKTKLETRYRDGRWQRYLKTTGWTYFYGPQVAPPAPEGPRLVEQSNEWIFTFGGDHYHPVTGESLADRYVVVAGHYEDARAKIVKVFDVNFGFQYATRESAGVDQYNLKELKL